MNILIVGLGLIGGSMAKALSKRHRVRAVDRSEATLEAALAAKAIEAQAAPEDFQRADVIFLCLYPEDVVKFTKEQGQHFGKNTLVTDVCGIKSGVCKEMKALSKAMRFTYVGGHPMAGKEESSFFASDPKLFRGASYIIAEAAGAPGTEHLAALAREMGFGKVIFTTAEEHDRMIAFTSQVPHVLACAYVMSPQCLKHEGFSAGSYRDVSRVAKINEELWSGLFLSNKERLCEELDILLCNLGRIREAVYSENRQALTGLLRQAREIKEQD